MGNTIRKNLNMLIYHNKIIFIFLFILSFLFIFACTGVQAASETVKIEAEDYFDMKGISKVTTTDGDLGQNVTNISNNDWMKYNLDDLETGLNYKLQFRVASSKSSGKISIRNGNNELKSINVPYTGSLTKWTTIETVVLIPDGMSQINIYASSGDWSFNWFSFTQIEPVSILEIQPASTFQLNKDDFTNLGRNVNLRQISMSEFIALNEDVNGVYDIVYIGSNNGTYTDIGTKPSKIHLKNGTDSFINNDTSLVINDSDPDSLKKIVTEYYSENDITNLKANKIIEFINSGQSAYFSNSIFSNNKTKLYKNFIQFRNSNGTSNKSNLSIFSSKPSAQTMMNNFDNAKKRPLFNLDELPTEYKSSPSGAIFTGNSLDFKYDIKGLNTTSSGQIKVELYFDLNGDSLFTSDEIVVNNTQSSGDDYSLSFPLSDEIVGYYEWKLVAYDILSDSENYPKNSIIGSIVRKGANPRIIKVLQIYPDTGNTLDLSNPNVYDPSLLDRAGLYKITISSMKISDFQNLYVKDPSYTLNGNYDMVIVGFKDSCDDITSKVALNDLKKFVETKQSLMLTHDTISYHINKAEQSKQGHYIANWFRDYVGLNRYSTDPMPVSGHMSYGLSSGALDRAKDGVLVTTENTIKTNSGAMTSYPTLLSGLNLTVRPTHYQWFQADLEDPKVVVWYTLYDTTQNIYKNIDPRNNYYTFSRGTVTFSGTGHSNMGDSTIAPDERKLFINTIIKASYSANHAPIVKINDLIDNQSITDNEQPINFSFEAHDVDASDTKLDCSVWVNNVKYKDYLNVDNNNKQNVTIPYDLFKDTENMTLTVKAKDKNGAESSQTINLKITPIGGDPIESMSLEYNYSDYEYSKTPNVVFFNSNTDIKVKTNFSLRRSVKSVKIPLSALKSGTGETVNFNNKGPTNTIKIQNVRIKHEDKIQGITYTINDGIITLTKSSGLPKGVYSIPLSIDLVIDDKINTLFIGGTDNTKDGIMVTEYDRTAKRDIETIYNNEYLRLFPSICLSNPCDLDSIKLERGINPSNPSIIKITEGSIIPAKIKIKLNAAVKNIEFKLKPDNILYPQAESIIFNPDNGLGTYEINVKLKISSTPYLSSLLYTDLRTNEVKEYTINIPMNPGIEFAVDPNIY